MPSSKIIKITIVLFITCLLLTVHLFFYFYYFSKPNATSLPSLPSPYASSEDGTNYTSPLYIIGYILGVISTFCTGDLLFAYCRSYYNETRLIKTIEKGSQPETDVSDDQFIPRPIIVDRLKKFFQPSKNQSFYHMICGEFGTGKTLLIKIASKEVEHGGVIYIDVPSDIEDFGIAFGKALNFTFEEDVTLTRQLIQKIRGTNDEFKISKWKRALRVFKHIAKVYKAKHNRPPIIIYDNVSRLARKNPDILYILQDDAKDNADSRDYIAVFVASEGVVPEIMMSRSAWSRAKKPPIEIGDISKEDSMRYLIEMRKIDEATAKVLYKMVGGRILELKDVADDILAGQSIEDIKEQKLIEIEKKFYSAKLLENQKYHEVGKHVINTLLSSKKINIKIFVNFFKNIGEGYSEVLGANVFAYRPSSNTVSFQSQSVEYYIQENSNIFVNLINLASTNNTSNEFDFNQVSTSK